MQPTDDDNTHEFTTPYREEVGVQPVIQDLFPQLSVQELQDAEENLVEYLKVVLRISNRLRQRRDFDGHRENHYDEDERSNLTN